MDKLIETILITLVCPLSSQLLNGLSSSSLGEMSGIITLSFFNEKLATNDEQQIRREFRFRVKNVMDSLNAKF